MNQEEIDHILRQASQRLIEEQPELLALGVAERTLAQHLAAYIAKQVRGYDVDVEYNRHGLDPKCLNLPPRNKLDGAAESTRVFPDLIIHKRNTNSNILVVEMKKSRKNIAFDELKLKAFRRELGYQYAAHVILARGKVPEIIWVD